MTSGADHRPHGKLRAPHSGTFALHEVALYGTTCDAIRSLVETMAHALPEVRMAYVDEDHHPSGTPAFQHLTVEGGALASAGLPSGPIDLRNALGAAGFVWVNGNHHTASRQVIVADPQKEASLRKRAAQLTDPVAVVLPGGMDAVPAYILELVPAGIPVVAMHEPGWTERLFGLLFRPAPLKGLVLAGGRSERMGRDKSRMDYHGRPQYQFMAEELRSMGLETVIACREDQRQGFEAAGWNVFTDRLLHAGPLGAILTAFLEEPESAWFVVATDMPGLDREGLGQLLRARRPARMATAFSDPAGLPEPLCAIWEPASRMRILQAMGAGIQCPRKVLLQSGIQLVTPEHARYIANANTPEEAAAFGARD